LAKKDIESQKEDVIEIENCIVTEVLRGAKFMVELPNGVSILAHVSGKLRKNYIRILKGDRVTVEMSPYDLTVGRITWRSKGGPVQENKEIREVNVSESKAIGQEDLREVQDHSQETACNGDLHKP